MIVPLWVNLLLQMSIETVSLLYEFSCGFSDDNIEKSFIIFITNKWFSFVMNYFNMLKLISASVIHFLTNVIFIPNLFNVNWVDVYSETAFRGKSLRKYDFRGILFATSITFVSFNSSVSNTVTFKVRSIISWIITFSTSKPLLHWSIKMVSFLVVLMCFVIGKNLITRWARKTITC